MLIPDCTDNKELPKHGMTLKSLRDPLKERITITTHCENPSFFSFLCFQRKEKKEELFAMCLRSKSEGESWRVGLNTK
jgi:hypothetical protein